MRAPFSRILQQQQRQQPCAAAQSALMRPVKRPRPAAAFATNTTHPHKNAPTSKNSSTGGPSAAKRHTTEQQGATSDTGQHVGSHSGSYQHVMQLIKAASSVLDMEAAVRNHKADMRAAHVSAAVVRLASGSRGNSNGRSNGGSTPPLKAAAHESEGAGGARGSGSTTTSRHKPALHGAASDNARLADTLLSDILPQCLTTCRAHHTANIIHAIAKAGWRHHGAVAACLEQFSATLATATSLDLSNVLWALGRLASQQTWVHGNQAGHETVGRLLPALVERTAQLMPLASPQDVANSVWAVAKMAAAQTPPSGRGALSMAACLSQQPLQGLLAGALARMYVLWQAGCQGHEAQPADGHVAIHGQHATQNQALGATGLHSTVEPGKDSTRLQQQQQQSQQQQQHVQQQQNQQQQHLQQQQPQQHRAHGDKAAQRAQGRPHHAPNISRDRGRPVISPQAMGMLLWALGQLAVSGEQPA